MQKRILALAALAAVFCAAPSVEASSNIALAPSSSSSVSTGTSVSSGYHSNWSPYESFTGLVVDCRGLGLNRAMSPVVKSASGEAVYGTHITNYSLVTSIGAVGYSDDERYVARAGSHPLFVHAEALLGNSSNPVISDEDARHVLSANYKTGFLDNMNVVFLR